MTKAVDVIKDEPGVAHHDCRNCAYTKRIMVDEVDDEDVDAYEIIMTGINTSQASKNLSVIEHAGASQETIKIYLNTVLDREDHYKRLETQWWRDMIKKYKIDNFTKIDVINRQFYVCRDDKGNETLNFKPKLYSESQNEKEEE
jgi:dissimilatory sulfite reductase (desulfoviridin) alpha/beta subunit